MVVHGKQLFFTILSLLLIMPAQVFASGEAHLQDFTAHWGGIICIIVFCLSCLQLASSG
jgi:hypothetical protein